MLVSMNWVRDFVNLDGLDLDDLIRRFTLSTAEVEDVIRYGEGTRGIVAAQILSVQKHPESRKLHLLKVDKGDAVVDVVCGAPNVREGMRVAFAPAGSSVGGHDIGVAQLAGHKSNGMCCSEAELGLSDENDGILDLDFDGALGTPLENIAELSDTVFELDNKSLTNRPDLWGIYGIAREFAALAGRELQPIDRANLADYNDLPGVKITLESPLCQRYSALKVEGISVSQSPLNMRTRLSRCGMRGINLLADLTNYLMLEMGQPMHAFDQRRVSAVRVKTFDAPFTFQTLDGQERNIYTDTLMICAETTSNDTARPVAIAGIMGGLDSEIKDDTDSLLLESATFDPVSSRKSSSRLGLRTDASARYEKALDPEMTVNAIARFLKLLQAIDPGVRVSSRLSDARNFAYPPLTLTLEKHFINRYTGIPIDDSQILKILTSLGFGVIQSGETFTVQVPSWRATKDVTIPADLIEEITRVYGYDNFEIHSTRSVLYPVREDIGKTQDTIARDFLVARANLHEVHSYLWCDKEKFAALGLDVEENIRLINSVNPNHEVLRGSMVPTLLSFLQENRGYAGDFGVFEIGRVIAGTDEDGLCRERKTLGIALFSRDADEETLFFRLRDRLSDLLLEIKRLRPVFLKEEPTHAWQHPVNTFGVILSNIRVGTFGTLHPANARKIDKKAAIVFAEIDMHTLAELAAAPIKYREPSKYPGIDVDLSFVLGSGGIFAQIADAIAALGCDLLSAYSLADVFEPDDGKTSVTVRLSFASNEKTLARAEIQPALDLLVGKLQTIGIALKA
ncbi:MAG: phenylalanine--tRNA ligase subunit beta [Oscillospiraceae bacterium]|jgi:phenylalanyl-tRNA synthetase beta chain|nr:phenylalanine--tRNA ligase subunit beta [Oscillospiraceae bacterium]